jgi:predicted AAA+ superfamily ATPase
VAQPLDSNPALSQQLAYKACETGTIERPMSSLFLEPILNRLNPFWQGKPLVSLPAFKRWAFQVARQRLDHGLAKATVLSGPRQVGKSTLVLQIIQQLLAEGVAPRRILYVQFDELAEILKLKQPILQIVSWFEQHILRQSLNEAAQAGQRVYLFLDEVQNLDEWAPQLKHLVDTSDVRVLVTGSSALRIEQGRDSLAGRITTLEMGTLFLREIMALRREGELLAPLPLNGLSPLRDRAFWEELRAFGIRYAGLRDRAFAAFSERGAYPIAHAYPDVSWAELADQLNETVIRRAIVHDLRLGPKGAKRDPQLIEALFRLACRYAGQTPKPTLFADELKQVMDANVSAQRIAAYLSFLDGTLLLRMVEPLEIRLKRRRSAAKICLCDHALRASWLQEVVPLAPDALDRLAHLRDLAGHLAESAVGYFLKSITNIDLAHFPERHGEPEVDFVLSIGEQRVPLEVKYRRRIEPKSLNGLRHFLDKPIYNAPFGVLVTLSDDIVVDDPRIVCLPLSTLLLMR